MKVITEEYRRLNQQLHEDKPSYGSGGAEVVKLVKKLAKEYRCATVLDYGCGKAVLSKKIGWFGPKVYNYDPAVPEYASWAWPSDMVVCTDVLEHIEPELLDNVLDHIERRTLRLILLSVSTRPAHKTLSDGRNAHLIQEPIEWWMPKLRERFNVVQFWGTKNEFYVIGTSKS